MTYEEICNKIENKGYDVTDEMVSERNVYLDGNISTKDINEMQTLKEAEFVKDCVDYIKSKSFSGCEASVIFGEAYERGHSSGYSETLNQVERLCEFVHEVNNAIYVENDAMGYHT
jgi:hypothetical protein